MGFTGKLGTAESQLGFFVLGIVDSFGLIPIQCNVYPNSSRSIIITFENPVTDSALVASRYIVQPTSEISGRFWSLQSGRATGSTVEFVSGQQLTVTSGPNNSSVLTIATAQDGVYTFVESILADPDPITYTTGIPFAVSVSFLDPNKRSVQVNFGADLEPGNYEIIISNVGDFQGRIVESTPRPFSVASSRSLFAISAKFSSEGTIDILFDKPVNPYTTSGVFELLNQNGDSEVLSIVSWDNLGIPPNTIRLSTSSVPGVFAFESLFVSYSNVQDISLNSNDGIIPLTFENRMNSTVFSDIQDLHITEAFLLDRFDEYEVSVIRVYFNSHLDPDSAIDPGNWVITTECGHAISDDTNSVSSPTASDLPSLLDLVKELESKIYSHTNSSTSHLNYPSIKPIPDDSYSSLEECIQHLLSLVLHYNSHVISPDSHKNGDNEAFVEPVLVSTLPEALVLANTIRGKYETHRSNTRQVSLTSLPLGSKFPINNHASPDTYIQNSFGPSYFVDLYIDGFHTSQPIQIQCEIDSYSGSTTTDPNSTGKITIKEPKPGLFQLSKNKLEFWNKDTRLPDIESLKSGSNPLWMRYEREYTNDMFVYFLNKLFGSFNLHISPYGAEHAQEDSNSVPDSLFPDQWDPIKIQNSITVFYDSHFAPHIQSGVYHLDSTKPPSPQSVFDIYQELRIHNSCGQNSKNSKFGIHINPGPDFGKFPSPNMLSIDIPQPLSGVSIDVNSNSTQGFSYPSSGRSVIQTPGVLNNLDGRKLKTEETLQINFSEPLFQTPLNVNDFTIQSSGNIQVLDAEWVDDRTISLRVKGLLSDNSTVYCYNLRSKSGELI